MIRLLSFLIIFALLGCAAAWVADNPGHIILYWFDYRIDTSIAVLVAAIILLMVLIISSGFLIHSLLIQPFTHRKSPSVRHMQRAINELTYSVAALASADSKAAQLHTRKAEKLLGRSPLTLMLAAQAARSQGDDSSARQLLEQLLEFKETEYLAARGLSDAANSEKRYAQALNFAQRAYKLSPKDHASITALVSLYIKNGAWQEAMLTIRKAPRRAYAMAGLRKRHLGLVHLAYGKALLAEGNYVSAASQAPFCQKYLGRDVPAALFAASAYHGAQQTAKAMSVLRDSWKLSHHPQLLRMMRTVIANEPTTRQQTLLASMLSDTPLAGDAWHCGHCGHKSETWDLHCESCGAFDSAAWK